jgi:hypothetical protein
MYVPKRGRKVKTVKRTPSKSPPRSTSRKSRKNLKTHATEVEYKTPNPKLKRDEKLNSSTSKVGLTSKGSRKLIGNSSFNRKSR